ncbi:FAD-dependent monooxygenase [Streptomyces sp. NBC_00536]|uniref:NAD(P)/FAD-dependent oxidoreductase n=1 Tax=Streptomyces sp. NBC_00536 TaxID=2975769 RepID=UPI002E804A5E|nr:FAD-dependent monooxygenase [Streptomyces sp. NBC_00536]WUC82233.1 FAD-dependent monooxygenase [Streptomyces sp. NBC_00536]
MSETTSREQSSGPRRIPAPHPASGATGPAPDAAAAGNGTPPTRREAVVIGGGLAGMLAAAALAPYADRVTVIERDTLPRTPGSRAFLPQAQHAHMLWSGGADAIEALLPGFSDRLLAAGAHRIPLTSGMVALSPGGWYRRWRPTHHLLAATRDLIDWAVRQEVAELATVRIVEDTRVLGLTGDRDRVTGLRVTTRDGAEEHLAAALVVDAGGRGTRTPQWLRELGVPPVREELVDSGLVYASRLYQAPPGAERGFPVVNVQAVPHDPRPGKGAVIMPVEGGRWLVTLSGTRGGQPTGDSAAFEPFARSVRHPVVAELLRYATPLSGVTTFGHTANRRRYYEKCRIWPEGYVVLGDAVASYNPVYGHGMSVAAQGARALRRSLLEGGGLRAAGLARRTQRAVAAPVSVAWDLATGQDIFYPDAIGKRPGAADKLLSRYVGRLVRTATADFVVATALTEVMTLSAPITTLVRPRVLLHALLGPRMPQLTGPPLTERELGFTRRTDRSDKERTEKEQPAGT